MLKQRVLTALLLLPLTLGVVLAAPPWLFDVVLAGVLAILAVEFAALCRLPLVWRAVFAVIVVALFGVAAVDWRHAHVVAHLLLMGAVGLWTLCPLWLVWRVRLPDGLKILLGLPLLAGAGIALQQMKAMEPDGRWVLAVLLLVWAADVGAYALGRLAGRHKLAPAISPGKTWEGFFGGLLLAMLVAAAGGWLLDSRFRADGLVLALAIAVIAVVGDLVESLLKRQANVKDSGRLLPGHGGLLDRLDSLLAAAPLFLLLGLEIGIFGGVSGFGR